MSVVLDVFARVFISLACSSIVSLVSGNTIVGYALFFIAYGIIYIRILLGVLHSLYKVA